MITFLSTVQRELGGDGEAGQEEVKEAGWDRGDTEDLGGWEEEDCWENVEEVKDCRGKHQSMKVSLHNWAKGEVDQAAEVANQAKDANDHLH